MHLLEDSDYLTEPARKIRRTQTYDVLVLPNDYFGQNRQFIVVGLKELIREAQAKGFDIPTERTIIITGLRQGEAWINMTRIRGVDGTDLQSLTRGEIEGRRQIADIQRYLQEYVRAVWQWAKPLGAPLRSAQVVIYVHKM